MESTEAPEQTTTTSPTPTVPPTSSSPLPAKESTLEASSEPNTVIEKDSNGFTYYPCRFCGLTFNYMNTLRAHERVHDVAQPYKCGACGEAFHFACELEYHSQQHKDNKGYACDCGRRFFTYTELLYHNHKDEEPMRPIEVPVPAVPSTSNGYAALSQSDFNPPAFAVEGYEPKHAMKVYSDIRSRPYICEYCSKSYPESRQLATHMYSHRGEKTFNPRASRYLMGRNGVGYTDRPAFLY